MNGFQKFLCIVDGHEEIDFAIPRMLIFHIHMELVRHTLCLLEEGHASLHSSSFQKMFLNHYPNESS